MESINLSDIGEKTKLYEDGSGVGVDNERKLI